MRISDFQRRRILQLIKHFRVVSTKRRTLARAFSARDAVRRRAAGSSVDAGSPLRIAASMPEPSALRQVRHRLLCGIKGSMKSSSSYSPSCDVHAASRMLHAVHAFYRQKNPQRPLNAFPQRKAFKGLN